MTKGEKASVNRSRRSFLKKAIVGTVLAAPVVESLTQSDLLVKSAQAGTAGTFLVEVIIDSQSGGTGSVNPSGPHVFVPLGGSQMFTITPDPGSYIYKCGIDGSNSGPFTGIKTLTVSDNGQPLRQIYVLFATND